MLTFILILFMFMFKTSTPSSAKTLSNRPCLSSKRPTPGSSDPLIKPSSPAVCPEPSSSPKHVSSVTPRTGSSGAKEMKVKVRKAPLERTRLLCCGFQVYAFLAAKTFLRISSYLEAPHSTVKILGETRKRRHSAILLGAPSALVAAALRHRRGPWLGNRHSAWVPLSISDFGNRGVLPGCPHFGSDSTTPQPCLFHQFTPS